MGVIRKYYLVKIQEDGYNKPRYYASNEELSYGDKVVCLQRNCERYGYVVGTLECSEHTIRKLVLQLNAQYPLAKCKKYQEEQKDIFVLMGLCEKGQSPIDLLNKAIEELKKEDK